MSEIRGAAESLARRRYTTVIFRDRTTDGGYTYVASNPELEGCLAQGDTLAEAQENLYEFRVDYIEHLLETGVEVPQPQIVGTSEVPFSVNSVVLGSENDRGGEKPEGILLQQS